MKTLPDKGVIIRCVTTDQKVGGSSPSERANVCKCLSEIFFFKNSDRATRRVSKNMFKKVVSASVSVK